MNPVLKAVGKSAIKYGSWMFFNRGKLLLGISAAAFVGELARQFLKNRSETQTSRQAQESMKIKFQDSPTPHPVFTPKKKHHELKTSPTKVKNIIPENVNRQHFVRH